jgi:glycosyltransferase involved in cell wall biosynthesis
LAIVYFGLLNASKGLDLVLDAFEQVVRARPCARLLLIGGVGVSDPTDQLTAARLQARLNRLGDQVMLSGWLEPTALSEHLLAADIALLPYSDGASPRRGSLLACAEHGLPIISTHPANGVVANAIHAAPAEPRAMAEAILEVADNPGLSARLRDKSRALAESVSWPRIAQAHIEIYEALDP